MGLRVICGILGAALLAGCAGLQGIFKDPEVNLQRAVLRGVGPTGGAMDLIVGVHNPNNFDLHGTKLRVGFDVEDSHVGDLEYDNDFQVQKGDTAVLTLPVRFNWSGLASAARAALGYGEIPYSLKGLLTVETPFGDRQVSFTHQGRAPLNRIGGLMAIPTGQ
jgi:LEA14-like dessication related protein